MNAQTSSPPPGRSPAVPPAGPALSPDTPPGAEFFDRIRALGIVRPDEGRWAAGVCAGLARRWGLDPLLVRGLFLVVTIVGGFGLGLYGLLWLFLPHPDGRIHAQQVLRGVVTPGFVGALLFVLADLPLSNGVWFGPGFRAFGGLAWLLFVIFGIWWLTTRGRRRGDGPQGQGDGPQRQPASAAGEPSGAKASAAAGEPSSPATNGAAVPVYGTPEARADLPGGPESETTVAAGTGAPTALAGAGSTAPVAPSPLDGRRPIRALTMTTLGTALLAAGLVLLWDRFVTAVPGPVGAVAAAVALAVVASGIVLAGLIGRRPGGLAPIAVLLAIASVNAATWAHAVKGWDADRIWRPTTAAVAASANYSLGAGRAVLDLTEPGLISGTSAATPVTVPASIGAGELVVRLPHGVSAQVQAEVGLGDISDRVNHAGDLGGPGVSKTIPSGTGSPALIVKADVGVGHIQVEQGA